MCVILEKEIMKSDTKVEIVQILCVHLDKNTL